MRLLHIDTGRIFRGGQKQVFLLIRNLKKKNVTQFLACPENSPLRKKTADLVDGFFPLASTNLGRLFQKGKLHHFIIENKIDIIHAHDSHSHSLMILIKQKEDTFRLIVTRRSSGEIKFGSKTKYLKHKIHYIAISEHIKGQLLSGGVGPDQIAVIPSMVDAEQLETAERTFNFSAFPKQKKIIISIGAFDDKKGHVDALRGISCLREKRQDFTYILIGDGPKKGELEKFIAMNRLDDVINLAGWQDNPADTHAIAHIFLAPSREEGLGLALLEAMASGLPIVASDIPPHKELITDNENGLLFPAGDGVKMAERMELILENSNLASSLAAAARKTAHDFSEDIIYEKVYDLYCNISKY
jgi:glycosyltransferase involved in cell wall biosynthesis